MARELNYLVDPESIHLCAQVGPLVFGLFGFIQGEDLEVREGGSGIFVAPFLAITARHIIRDLYRVDGREPPGRPHITRHDVCLFQVMDPFRPKDSEKAIWRVNRTWVSLHTDIALLQVSAENDTAKKLQGQPLKRFEWKLSPPPVGARVAAFGFPGLKVTSNRETLNVQAPLELRYFRVTQIFPLARDRGLLNFPCFEVDESVGHGFSGGPVFYENRLCGIVSVASSFAEQSWIASLWPLTLMEYSDEFDRMTSFGEFLDRGVVIAEDWLELRHRISKGVDNFGQPYLRMDSER